MSSDVKHLYQRLVSATDEQIFELLQKLLYIRGHNLIVFRLIAVTER